jgi:hypothetical protein
MGRVNKVSHIEDSAERVAEGRKAYDEIAALLNDRVGLNKHVVNELLMRLRSEMRNEEML